MHPPVLASLIREARLADQAELNRLGNQPSAEAVEKLWNSSRLVRSSGWMLLVTTAAFLAVTLTLEGHQAKALGSSMVLQGIALAAICYGLVVGSMSVLAVTLGFRIARAARRTLNIMNMAGLLLVMGGAILLFGLIDGF